MLGEGKQLFNCWRRNVDWPSFSELVSLLLFLNIMKYFQNWIFLSWRRKYNPKQKVKLYSHICFIVRCYKGDLKRHQHRLQQERAMTQRGSACKHGIFWAGALRNWDWVELKGMACMQTVWSCLWGTSCSLCASGLPVHSLCQQLCLSQAGGRIFIQWVNFKWNENPSHNVWFTTQATGTVCLIND